MSSNKNPAVAVALDNEATDDIVTLSTGVRARILAVPTRLIQEASAKIPDPEIPTVTKDDGRTFENPDSPEYTRALERADEARGMAAMDVMILFGIVLIDEIPPVTEWMPKLRLAAKVGAIDMDAVEDFDLEDPLELEFVYKRYIATSAGDVSLVTAKSGVSEEDIRKAEDTFQGKGK